MRWFKIVLLGALALAGIAAQPGSAAAQDRVRIGQATSALSFLPIWAARALDTFKDEGLTLQWAAVSGGDPAALAALDSGDIDLAAVGAETALQAIAKGQPFQLVYSVMGMMSLELVMSSEFLTRSGVSPSDPLEKRIQSLKGATLGVSAVRGAQERVARWLVAQGGLDSNRDLKVAMIGPPPAIRAALENKQIDGFILSPPEGFLIEQSNAGKVLVRLGAEFPDLRTLHFLVLVAKRPLDGARRDLAVRAIRALQRAGEATVADPQRVAGEIHRRFYAQAKPEMVAAAVAAMTPGIARGGRFTPEEVSFLLRFTADTGGGLEQRLDAARGEGEFWTNALVEAARR